MNESLKTIVFVGAAVVVSLIVWSVRPRFPVVSTESELPKVLFPEFDDPLKATSLEIIEFKESTATLRPFKVAQVDGEWSIPSPHHNYPADAENQLAEVAAGFVGLKPLEMASDSRGDYKLYGVVDPDPKTLKPGDTGVGTRVEIRDKDDDVLLALIIGKEVPDQRELRYVREVGKDRVYTVKLKTDKLSTKFEDWIEDDLLKLNTWDVKRVQINDYSYDALTGRLDPRSRMALEYDDSDSKWKLIEDKVVGEREWVDRKMAEDEELNTTKLNDMKWALDDLKIVDVGRKPKGLSENLKDTGAMQLNMEDVQSLAERGFYIYQNQLLSSEGEIDVLMKDGVQYVLRFGQITGTGEEEAETEDEKGAKDEEEGEAKKSEDGGVNRYLFVMAEFNPEAIPKPELEPLPEEKETAEGKTEEGEASNGGEPEGQAPAAESAESAKIEPKEPEGEKPEAPLPEGETPEAKSSESEEPASSAEAAQESKQESEAEPGKEEEKSEIDKERERIEKENKRKQDEYDEKVKKGKERVQELNQRFADWYYVISDEVYQKIHLSHDDVVKKKEKEEADKEKAEPAEADQQQDTEPAKDEGDTVSDFERLKQEGLEEGKP